MNASPIRKLALKIHDCELNWMWRPGTGRRFGALSTLTAHCAMGLERRLMRLYIWLGKRIGY